MNCIAGDPLPAAGTTVYRLVSVSLMPLYFKSGLLEPAELKPVVDEIYIFFKKNGILTSHTELVSSDHQRSVGYDYGLVLYSMLQTGSKGQHEVYRKTLDIVDETGAWSEYYEGEPPGGTRCRPWESAINLEALIKYAKQYQE